MICYPLVVCYPLYPKSTKQICEGTHMGTHWVIEEYIVT